MPIAYNPSMGQDVQPLRRTLPQPPNVGGSTATAGAGIKSIVSGSTDPINDPIPNSTTYLNETNAANLAYDQAKSQLLAQRNSLYHQYGLTETGAVDVNNPYGDYQSLLGTEGAALDSARNDSVARGLGTGGLANQEEAGLIPGQRREQLGFQRNVDQAGMDYSQGLMSAESDRSSSYNQAYQDALMNAIASGLFTTASGGSNGGGSGGSDSTGGETTASSSQSRSTSNSPRAKTVSPGLSYYVPPAKAQLVAKASEKALTIARKSGAPAPKAALAARSAGLNAAYGLGAYKAPAKKTKKPAPYLGRH